MPKASCPDTRCLFQNGGSRRRSFVLSVCGTLVLQSMTVPGAEAANVIERAIEAVQPCRSLKLDLGFVSVGVDRFESVDVEEFLMSGRGDVGTARLVGSLACRTSASAFRTGSASAKVAFDAEFDLATCLVRRSEVRILQTGGEFGDVIATFSGSIEAALKAGLEKQIEKFCE